MSISFSITDYKHDLFDVQAFDFDVLAKKALQFQLAENNIFKRFCAHFSNRFTGQDDPFIFPFLPIHVYKTHPVITGSAVPSLFFESSGTTGQDRSRHYIADPALYEQVLTKGFEQFLGDPGQLQILALLPGYMEQPHSSLVYMMRSLMKQHKEGSEYFYLRQHKALFDHLQQSEQEGKKTLLVGVTHALLDFAETFPLLLKHTQVLETGGMKGRRKEMVREEVHSILKRQFGLEHIFSEYGMTELLSQAYALKDGRFICPPWMKVLVRDEDDPFMVRTSGRGALNIIDLANIHSCCFIATEDVGEVYEDGSFKVLGRMDQSEWRGCSLMAV